MRQDVVRWGGMNGPQTPEASERIDRPGKTRTWWHPLLARLLDHFLATAYAVRDEVLVGKLPLRVDILLIRRETGELPEASRRDLSVLVPLLNRFTPRGIQRPHRHVGIGRCRPTRRLRFPVAQPAAGACSAGGRFADRAGAVPE